MAYKKKTWQDKMADKKDMPKVLKLKKNFPCYNAMKSMGVKDGKVKKKDILPYWRTLKSKGFLNEKYPGGAKAQKKLLEKEGFKVESRGKKFAVKDYENHLVKV